MAAAQSGEEIGQNDRNAIESLLDEMDAVAGGDVLAFLMEELEDAEVEALFRRVVPCALDGTWPDIQRRGEVSGVFLAGNRLFMAAFVLSILPSSAYAEPYWPQFHGPNRDNVSTDANLLNEWPAGGPELVWTANGIGFGYSSVAIAGGRVFTAGNLGDNTVVTALDLDGMILWQTKNGKAWTTAYPGTRSTPTVDGDRVYYQSPLGDVACLDAETGEVMWAVNVLEKFESENIRWAIAESLLVDGDRLIVTPGGPKASLVALNKLTGDVVWTAESTGENTGYSSPTLFEQGGLRIIATMTAKAIIGVNADTGELLWRTDREAYTDQNTLIPLYHDGHIFVSTVLGDSIKWKVNVNDGEASLEEVWRNPDFDNQHGGVVMVNGNIYGASTARHRNHWVCLDWNTGELESLSTDVERGAITAADGLLYMLGQTGQMGLARPTDTGLELISLFQIPEGGEENSWAHPVVTGGRLYIRHGDFLYAYDISAQE